MNEIARCPNPECEGPCEIGGFNDAYCMARWIECPSCSYRGPRAEGATDDAPEPKEAEAIRLHNLISVPAAPDDGKQAPDDGKGQQ